MTRRLALAAACALVTLAPALAESAFAPPTLRVPGRPDSALAPRALLGRDSRDVRLEDVDGNVTVYHGMPLLEILEKNGLDVRSMMGERASAAVAILVTTRDGYAVVFSVGELRTSRANPKVFLVSETSTGPLPEKEGPVRLIVYGDPLRSAYALATIEMKILTAGARK